MAISSSQMRQQVSKPGMKKIKKVASALKKPSKKHAAQAKKLLDGSYKDWVKNPLTHGVGKDGEPREYGKTGSADKFTERLKGIRLYQPKPFMWLRSSGVKRHVLYKAGADLTGGPIGN